MALLKFKRSAVAGKVPSLSDLPLGELALNTFDGKIYMRKDNGIASIVEVAGGAGGVQSITSTDGSVTITGTSSVPNLSVAVAGATSNVLLPVRNNTGAILTKGTAVYINGALGQLSTVAKAIATSDATSAQTLGIVTADIAHNANGNVTLIGTVANIDTSAFTDGQQLYLSPSVAGTLTATKPFAPNHLVYMAVVEHAHPTQGKLFVKVQNGYEMDELHDVSAQSPSNNHGLFFNTATNLWEAKAITTALGTLGVANGGTGTSTQFTAGSVLFAGASGVYSQNNANLFWDNTNARLGIGTNAPAYAFQVAARVSIGNDGVIQWGQAFTGTARGTLSWDTNIASVNAAGNLVFGSNGTTERMRIDTSGNVGIGNNNPTARLHIVGATHSAQLRLQDTVTDATNKFGVIGAGHYTNAEEPMTLAWGFSGLSSNDLYLGGGVTTMNAATTVRFITAANNTTLTGTERMRIDSAGNVGIGTTNPTSLLQIQRTLAVSDWNAITLANVGSWSTAAGTGALVNVTDGTGTVGKFGITYDAASQGAFVIRNLFSGSYGASGDVFYARGDGRVGIGTNTPSSRLHLAGGSFYITGSGTYAEPAIVAGVVAFDSVNGDLNISARSNGGNTFTRFFTSDAGAGGERMRITNAGNVGIGTTSPAYKFVVSNAGAAGLEIDPTGLSSAPFIQSYNRSGAAYTQLGFDALQYVWRTSGTERMRMTNSGLVGIGTGTTTPAASLHIVQPSLAAQLRLQDVTTDVTTKYGTIGSAHYTNIEEPFALLTGASTATGNTLSVGGGVTSMNTATVIALYTAGNNTTLTGTERMRINASGDVGIGTSSPVHRVSIQRTAAVGTQIALNLNNPHSYGAASGVAAVGIRFNRTPNDAGSTGVMSDIYGGNEEELTSTKGYLAFATRNGVPEVTAEHMRINALGNVGIGTASPTAKLTVNGTAKIGEGVATNTSKLMVNTATGVAAGIQLFQDNNESWIIQNPASSTVLTFSASGNERMRITSAGNVGIGNTSPSTPLDVTGTTRSGNFRVNGGGSVAGSGMWGTDTELAFNTNSGERVRINSTGNVGIGTASPNSQLHISFSPIASIPALGSGVGAFAIGPAANYGMLLGTISNGTGYIQQQRFDATTTVYPIALQPNGGNVGVGTSSPNYKLEARTDGISAFNWVASYNDTATNGFGAGFLARAGTNIGYFYMRGDGIAFLENSGNNPLGFATNAIERMRITNDGNFGIGLTSPSEKFVILVNTAANGFEKGFSLTNGVDANLFSYVTGTATTDKRALITAGAASQSLAFGTLYTERMRITSAGDVGIGTTAPSGYGKLAVVGGNLGVSQDGGTVTTIRGNANVSNIGAYNATGATLTFSTAASGSGETERMRITSTGLVGIGATPSAARLEVNGNIRSTVGSGGTLTLFETDATRANQLVSGADASGSYINASFSTGGSAVLRIQTANSERMRIDASGNVGIGATSVSGKLDIVGGATQRKIQVSGSTFTDTVADVFISRTGTNGVGLAQAPSLQFGNATDASGVILQGSNQFQIFTNNAGAGWIERLRVDSTGNLLVGTTTTQGRFNVNSATGNVGFNTGTSSAPERGNLWYDTDGTGWRFNLGKRQGGVFTSQMTLQDNGNVGIGTTSPLGTLDVAGTTGFTWAAGGNSTALAVIGTQGTTGGSLFVNTPSLNSSFASGLVIDGSYSSPLSTINIKAVGVNSGGGYGSIISFQTASESILSERMRINNSGNVGIATTSPWERLSLPFNAGLAFGSSAYSYKIQRASAGSLVTTFSDTYVDDTTRVDFTMKNGAVTALSLLGSGRVGVGTTAPTTALHVIGAILASDNVTAFSDIRIKDNIEQIDGALDRIQRIRGVTYTRTDTSDKERRYAGVIAQEIEEVLPEAIFHSDDIKSVDYNATIGLLIEAIKELKAEVEQLKGK